MNGAIKRIVKIFKRVMVKNSCGRSSVLVRTYEACAHTLDVDPINDDHEVLFVPKATDGDRMRMANMSTELYLPQLLEHFLIILR